MCEGAALIPGRLLAGELEPLLAHAADCAPCRAALLEQGAWPPGCGEPRRGHQVLLHLELLARPGAEGAPELRQHLESCPACAAEVEEAAAALGALEAKELLAAAPAPPVPHTIALACTFCHDRLARELAAYCASCLAPHHAGCFAEHGRCAAPGCGEPRWVRPGHVPTTPRVARRVAALASAALVAAGLVALAGREGEQPAPRPRPAGPGAPVVAWVGGAPILRSELELACRQDPTWGLLPGDDLEGRRGLRLERLEELIEERALAHLAMFEGVLLSGEESSAVFEHVAQVAWRDEALRGAPQEVHDLLLERELRRATIARLFEREGPAADPAPGELERWWEAHPLQRGGRARVQEVVLFPRLEDAATVPPLVAAWANAHGGWDPALCARELLRRVRAGEASFGEVARGASMGGSAPGEELTLEPEQLLPALGAALERLEPGVTSEPIVTYTGSVHLLRLIAREGARLVPLSEAREQALAGWREDRRATVRRELVRRARLSASIEVPDLSAALADGPGAGGAH